MKKTLLLLTSLFILFSACKKETPNNAEFPATYKFLKNDNKTASVLLTENNEFTWPNHPLLTSNYMIAFNKYVLDDQEDQKGATLTFNANNTVTYTNGTESSTELFVKSGEYYIVAGLLAFKAQGPFLFVTNVYGNIQYNGSVEFGGFTYPLEAKKTAVEVVKEDLFEGDTAVVRTFQSIWSKQ